MALRERGEFGVEDAGALHHDQPHLGCGVGRGSSGQAYCLRSNFVARRPDQPKHHA
jgi:hypothetical protein